MIFLLMSFTSIKNIIKTGEGLLINIDTQDLLDYISDNSNEKTNPRSPPLCFTSLLLKLQ